MSSPTSTSAKSTDPQTTTNSSKIPSPNHEKVPPTQLLSVGHVWYSLYTGKAGDAESGEQQQPLLRHSDIEGNLLTMTPGGNLVTPGGSLIPPPTSLILAQQKREDDGKMPGSHLDSASADYSSSTLLYEPNPFESSFATLIGGNPNDEINTKNPTQTKQMQDSKGQQSGGMQNITPESLGSNNSPGKTSSVAPSTQNRLPPKKRSNSIEFAISNLPGLSHDLEPSLKRRNSQNADDSEGIYMSTANSFEARKSVDNDSLKKHSVPAESHGQQASVSSSRLPTFFAPLVTTSAKSPTTGQQQRISVDNTMQLNSAPPLSAVTESQVTVPSSPYSYVPPARSGHYSPATAGVPASSVPSTPAVEPTSTDSKDNSSAGQTSVSGGMGKTTDTATLNTNLDILPFATLGNYQPQPTVHHQPPVSQHAASTIVLPPPGLPMTPGTFLSTAIGYFSTQTGTTPGPSNLPPQPPSYGYMTSYDPYLSNTNDKQIQIPGMSTSTSLSNVSSQLSMSSQSIASQMNGLASMSLGQNGASGEQIPVPKPLTRPPPKDDAEAKRQEFLEKNRQAAYKCRQKKKKRVEEMQVRHTQLTKENAMLTAEVGKLRQELLSVHNLLYQCRDCPVTRNSAYAFAGQNPIVPSTINDHYSHLNASNQSMNGVDALATAVLQSELAAIPEEHNNGAIRRS